MRSYNPHEQLGSIGQSFLRGDQAFRSFINQCNLMDMGYNGVTFTWRRGNLFEQLDRALVSYDWCVRFPDASLSHLNPLKSNHAPILVRLYVNRNVRISRRPFRFEAEWMTHEEFSTLIRNVWDVN
ncbi:uncharacterized protein LOC109811508 [Cajanus cajan]|uniref:uncharacterized protein LOC109811508 n=1 Tax=Cajanus cajan TaxID=3821 RepID=UPI00098D96F5|nr:uncharacterized protein LOC109811508 [Cajanus cajan]